MINAVIIPPAVDEPLERITLPKDFRLTRSTIKLHGLEDPAMYLYSKGINRPPFNIRATLILWVHDRHLAYHTMVSGHALLTGRVDSSDADVPEEIIELIFKAQRYKVEAGDQDGGMTYEELPFAYAAAVYHTASPKPGGGSILLPIEAERH